MSPSKTGGHMQLILKRAAFAVLGVVMMLAWWTFTGSKSSNNNAVQGIPSKVWEGNGGTLAVSVETTSAARFSISFADEKDRRLEAWTPVKAGTHDWTMSIPRGAGGFIELDAENPKPGDKLHWEITLNGKTVDEQTETLDGPLQPGYAFFLQVFRDDYSQVETDEHELAVR